MGEKILTQLNLQNQRKDEDIQDMEVILDAICNNSVGGELRLVSVGEHKMILKIYLF